LHSQFAKPYAPNAVEKSVVQFSQSVQECIFFNRLELALIKKQMPDLFETLIVGQIGWSCWSQRPPLGSRCASSAKSRSEPLIETIYLATLRDN
jgi:hypothetical protein